MEGLQDGDRLLMRTAEKIRLDFLCQNSFTEDAYTSPESTIEHIAALIEEHDRLAAALDGGALLDDLLKEAADAPR
jgi:V/A-type H+-transporting ATPase subunit A